MCFALFDKVKSLGVTNITCGPCESSYFQETLYQEYRTNCEQYIADVTYFINDQL